MESRANALKFLGKQHLTAEVIIPGGLQALLLETEVRRLFLNGCCEEKTRATACSGQTHREGGRANRDHYSLTHIPSFLEIKAKRGLSGFLLPLGFSV